MSEGKGTCAVCQKMENLQYDSEIDIMMLKLNDISSLLMMNNKMNVLDLEHGGTNELKR
jgi:hypothetical protein